jgi:signal transduction histidine kinase
VRTLIARVRRIDLRVFDWVLAVALTVGALRDAAAVLGHGLNAAEIVSCAVVTASIAWRRVNAVLTTAVAITGYPALVLLSGYSGAGTYEWAAIALSFYTLGRGGRGSEGLLTVIGLFAYWLVGSVVIWYVPAGGSVGVVFATWTAGVSAFVFGRMLTTRSALTRELKRSTARLEDEQEVRARRAAAEERNRMARELHDVIAHSVSVMVIQASGAQRVARRDLDAARNALEVVESAGREALVELRRIVGVLRRGSDELVGSAAPGLSQLDALVERSRAAGLAVELCVEGQSGALSPGLDLVAYRVLQEALTNAIKHAGRARARVTVTFGPGELNLEVSDTGDGPTCEPTGDGSGHGLVGMSERVALYGGELSAGPRPGGGFDVRARIPLEASAASPPLTRRSPEPEPAGIPNSDRLRWPWLDPVLAGMLLVMLVVAVLTASDRRGPLAVNMVVAAAMALAAVQRRRWPVLFVAASWVFLAVMNHVLTPMNNQALPKSYFFVIPTYTLGAWTNRRTAFIGIALLFGVSLLGELTSQSSSVAEWAGVMFAFGAGWAAGRAIRAIRMLSAELQRTSERLELEREDRARLAVAGERSRIARELHAVVANSVATMVVQTEASLALLDRDPVRAAGAMSAIEDTGRQSLAEMRRILGVLRHGNDPSELAPQPGVDQIYALIQRARERGQPIELTVEGDPGTLAAGVDLGIYRIVEEALQAVRQTPASPIGVSLRFGEQDLELHLTARCDKPSSWPTDAMRERVALCGGQLQADPRDGGGWQFATRMPRGLQGAFA